MDVVKKDTGNLDLGRVELALITRFARLRDICPAITSSLTASIRLKAIR